MYSRTIDGKNLTLAPSGWTYGRTFVLADRETGSLWYPDQKGLKAIQGVFRGRYLSKIPSEVTTWSMWAKRHPETRVLK